MPAIKKTILSIVIIWSLYLLILAVLQVMGLPFGFHIIPMQEDRIMLTIYFHFKGADIPRTFWNINDRYPLVAWFHCLISPLVRWSDYSLYAIRKFMDLVLALSYFVLVDKLGKGKYRTFTFATTLTIVFWNFSSYYSHLLWCSNLILSICLFSIFFFCRYVDNNRETGNDLAISLLFYLVTLASYTIFCGSIIAVSALSFFRKKRIDSSLIQRIVISLQEISFFSALYIIYDLIWITIRRNSFYKLSWNLFHHQYHQSIHQFIFPEFYKNLYQLTITDFSTLTIACVLIVGFFSFLAIFLFLFKMKIINDSTNVPYLWIMVILVSIAFPIFILESTSLIWSPGTRSTMIYQVWDPVLYVCLIFLFVKILPIKKKSFLLFILLSILSSITFLGGLDYNYHLVKRSRYEENLAKGLKSIHIPPGISARFLVKNIDMNDHDLNSISPVIPNYGQTLLRDDAITLRVMVAVASTTSEWDNNWKQIFGPDNVGVINATEFGNLTPISYKDLWIVFFDGNKVTVPDILNKSDFEGTQFEWKRTTPINQKKLHSNEN